MVVSLFFLWSGPRALTYQRFFLRVREGKKGAVIPKARMLTVSASSPLMLHSVRVDSMPHNECVVCFEPTAECCMPCRHPMCHQCSSKWFRKKTICPMCRQVPASYHSERPVADGERDVVISSFPLGLTVWNRGRDVCVAKTVARDSAARAGLRPGDRIVHVNDIPVQRHGDMIEICRCNEVNGTPLRIGIVPVPRESKPSWRFRWPF